MAMVKQSAQVAAGNPLVTADGAHDLVPVFGDYTLVGDEASGDVIEMVGLPAGYVIVDAIIDTQDMGTTATSGVGILTGAYGDTVNSRTGGSEIMAAKAFGTAGIYRMDVAGAGRIAPTTADRGLGVTLTTVDTPTAGAAIRMTVLIRPQIDAA